MLSPGGLGLLFNCDNGASVVGCMALLEVEGEMDELRFEGGSGSCRSWS